MSALRARAANYVIPSERDYQTMKTVVQDDIPGLLSTANCGYKKNLTAREALTKVDGVPLRPPTWLEEPTAGPSDLDAGFYPTHVTGLSFANYRDGDICQNIRDNRSGTNPLAPCSDPNECQSLCAELNSYQYEVYRANTCRQWVQSGYWTDDGYWIDTSHYEYIYDICNGDSECSNFGDGWEVDPGSYVYAGNKYTCTGDYNERTDPWPWGSPGPVLKVPFGWVWSTISLPDYCRSGWVAEPKEYKNCTTCGEDGGTNIGKGEQCRSGEGIPPPDNDDGTPFDPSVNWGWRNDASYESFTRRYTASHILGPIPDTEHEDESEKVNLACYDWYNEFLDPRDRSSLTCIADDLHISSLEQRKVNGSDEFTLDDAPPEPLKTFGFDPDKSTSKITAPTLPPTLPKRPFGETPKYVTVMQELERKLEDYPPSVELILPLLEPLEELSPLLAKTGSASQTLTNLTHIEIPLQPGLIEEVRGILRRSLLSRIEEKAIPVVIPLLSEEQIQSTIQAWESWKKEREEAELDVPTETDDLLAKLEEYRDSIERFRTMREELPLYLQSVFDRERELLEGIDSWVEEKMQPYQYVLGNRIQEARLVAAWRELKDAHNRLGFTNEPYCKNDRSTPPLEWMEMLGEFELPEMPDEPRHLVFDFSSIFFSEEGKLPTFYVPVFLPIQVALDLPSPPPSLSEGTPYVPKLPSLPSVPDLPLPLDNLTVRYVSSPETNPSSIDFDSLTTKFRLLAMELNSVADNYKELLWIKDPHYDFACPTFGANGCVFPETKLWHVFMRIWAPLGAFLDPDAIPLGLAPELSPKPDCPAGDIPCLLEERVTKRSLQITPPAEESEPPMVNLRTQMREFTIDPNGELVPDSEELVPPYRIGRPQDLYEVYPVPLDIPLNIKP